MKNIIKNIIFVLTVFLLVISFLPISDAASATKKPTTVAEIALYKGVDRQQILEEGAKKEGALVFYTSGILTQAVNPVVDSFRKKYPYIKVDVWRAGSEALVPRVFEEVKAGKLAFDVIENTQTGYLLMQEQGGILQPFASPNFAFMEEDSITKAPGGGAFRVAFRESGHSIGYNTKLLTRENLPKSYRDLLDPKWKDRKSVV
jgi:iron(III) transport system substrate-binding protein